MESHEIIRLTLREKGLLMKTQEVFVDTEFQSTLNQLENKTTHIEKQDVRPKRKKGEGCDGCVLRKLLAILFEKERCT